MKWMTLGLVAMALTTTACSTRSDCGCGHSQKKEQKQECPCQKKDSAKGDKSGKSYNKTDCGCAS